MASTDAPQTVPAIAPDGTDYDLPVDQIANAKAKGWTVDDPNESALSQAGTVAEGLGQGAIPAMPTDEKFLDAMKSHSYKYKDPDMAGAAPGTHFGPMAQEIEKGGPAGKALVHEGPDGVKRVDTNRLPLTLASGLGNVHRRLAAVEELLKSKQGASHGA